MRRLTSGVLILVAVAAGACAPALDRVSPQLMEYRLVILVRAVQGRCRTTTFPALALVTSRQTVTWEVVSLDRGACRPEDVRIAIKPRGGARTATTGATPAPAVRYPPEESFKPAPGERAETWSVRGLRPGRYQYNVSIGAETEDPELEIWR